MFFAKVKRARVACVCVCVKRGVVRERARAQGGRPLFVRLAWPGPGRAGTGAKAFGARHASLGDRGGAVGRYPNRRTGRGGGGPSAEIREHAGARARATAVAAAHRQH